MTGDDAAAPVVVTLALDAGSQRRLDAVRRTYFPPERNHLAAHVTLFHALPGAELPRLRSDVDGAVSGVAPFLVRVTGVRSLGRGVAYALAAPELDRLRSSLAAAWQQWLTPQDRQPFRPHVTVQNKVTPEVARRTYEDLAASPLPPDPTAVGVALWRYRGGPWDPVATIVLTAP